MTTTAAAMIRDPLIYEFDTEEEEQSYDKWLKSKVQKAISNPAPPVPHDEAIARLDAIIARAKARKNA